MNVIYICFFGMEFLGASTRFRLERTLLLRCVSVLGWGKDSPLRDFYPKNINRSITL
jgi:hypothetical protein